jgi:hypothetical protein
MITLSYYLSRSRFALICLTMMLGVGQVGIIAAQAGTPRQRLSQSVNNDVGDPELKKYAKALIEIEPLRIAALEAINSKVEGDLPKLLCHQPDSMSTLPGDARKVFVNYCNQSQSIAQGYGLGIERFNEITSLVLANSKLQGRLQRQVTCLHDGSC